MYAPAVHDEITTLVGYVDQQLDAIRAAAFGLTEEQARERPCRSALSVAGILKHVTYGLRGYTERLASDETPPMPGQAEIAKFMDSFALTEDQATVGMLTEFDEARERYVKVLATVDPDSDMLAPPAPWHGITEARPIKTRYALGHHVEEFARHAGHADIIREQIDGISVPALVMTREGAQPSKWFQPFVPPAGTITV
jgi:hypothetical protein